MLISIPHVEDEPESCPTSCIICRPYDMDPPFFDGAYLFALPRAGGFNAEVWALETGW